MVCCLLAGLREALAGVRDGWETVLPFDEEMEVRGDVLFLRPVAVVLRGCVEMLFPLTAAVKFLPLVRGEFPWLMERLLVEGFVTVAACFEVVVDALGLGFGATPEVSTLELGDGRLVIFKLGVALGSLEGCGLGSERGFGLERG